MPEIYPHSQRLDLIARSKIKGHRPAVIWLTGLSGSGKSTLANALEVLLNAQFHAHTCLLDGDNLRTGLNRDLGFSLADRAENIRRVGEVARLFYDAGLIAITAFISPLRADRLGARQLLPPGGFIEVYMDCPLPVCEQRDPKGLYRKARAGLLPEFTGITSPFEAPESPELRLEPALCSVEQCVQTVVEYLLREHFLESRND